MDRIKPSVLAPARLPERSPAKPVETLAPLDPKEAYVSGTLAKSQPLSPTLTPSPAATPTATPTSPPQALFMETSAPASSAQASTLEETLRLLQRPKLSPAGDQAYEFLLHKESQPPTSTQGQIPMTFEEAQAVWVLREESKDHSQRLVDCLARQNPDAVWLAEKLKHASLKEVSGYQIYVERPWKNLCQAREVAQTVASGRQMLKIEGAGISGAEADAVNFLATEKPAEFEQMARNLEKRGDKAAWMVAQSRQRSEFDGQGDGYANGLSERWSARAASFKLIAQLEKAGASAPPSDLPPPPQMTLAEARAVHCLRYEDPEAAQKLRNLLLQRNPSDGWMADSILKRTATGDGEFALRSFQNILNQRTAQVQAYGLLQKLQAKPPEPGPFQLSAEEAESYRNLDQIDPPAGQRLSQLLSRRGPGVAWALERSRQTWAEPDEIKQEWQQLEAARGQLEKVAQSQSPSLSPEEASATKALALLHPADAEKLKTALAGRGPMAAWMAQEIITKKNHSEDLTSPEALESMQARWAELQAAELTLTGLDQSRPPGPPMTFAEANALATFQKEWSQENYSKQQQLLAALKERSPDAGWFWQRANNREPLTLQRYEGLVKDHGDLTRARQLAEQAGQTKADDLTFQEAEAIQTLRRLDDRPGEESLAARLSQRGPKALLILGLVNKSGQQLGPEDFAQLQSRLQSLEPALEVYREVTSQPQVAVAPGQLPVTTQEAAAVAQLAEASWALGHSLKQALKPRSDFIQQLPAEMSEYKGDVPGQLVRQHDAWLLNTAFRQLSTDVHEAPMSGVAHYSAYQFERPLNLGSLDQAKSYVRLAQKLKAMGEVKPELVKALSQLPGVDSLPLQTLAPLVTHLQTGDSLQSLSQLGDGLPAAARAWQAQPGLPPNLALELGAQPLHEVLKGAIAWQRTQAQPDLSPADQETTYRQHLAELAGLNKSDTVLQLKPDQLPLAIELVQARTLDSQERLALYSALRNSPEPMKTLLSFKGAPFKEALQALMPKSGAEENQAELTTYDYRTKAPFRWQPAGALGLALTFRGSWRQWLDAQARMRGGDGEPVRTAHDAVDILPLRPASQLTGLDQFLLKNSSQPLLDFMPVVGRWEQLTPEELALPFDELVAVARLKVYPHMEAPEFGLEAARWGIREQDYPEMETRFVQAQNTPSPFADLMDKRWKSHDLTGRFLPRNDVRGPFLGNHTQCCQHPTGAGADCAWHGLESPRGGFFVLENPQGEAVVQSWAWVSDNGGLVFDNVEGLAARTSSAQATKEIYQAAADDLVKRFPVVTLGLGHGKLDTKAWPDAADATQVMKDYEGYSDADKQVLLARL